ncbi:hypothetical protein TWF718_003776 [Orbilia javanica]|uniref:Uncharacterized protein n=1 Tax=Orbilia javanica TaxID=47235 RepID=A0AAN8N1C9_9PEZI
MKVKYIIVLCPKYFQEQAFKDRLKDVAAMDWEPKKLNEAKNNIWTSYPSAGAILLHLLFHLPFITSPSLYIGDAVGYYGPEGSAQLALKSPDQSTRTAENYAMAALAVAQITEFNLERAPSFDGGVRNLEPNPKDKKLPDNQTTLSSKKNKPKLEDGENQEQPGAKQQPPGDNGRKKGVAPVPHVDLKNVTYTEANYTLHGTLTEFSSLPKDFDRRLSKGIPSIH